MNSDVNETRPDNYEKYPSAQSFSKLFFVFS